MNKTMLVVLLVFLASILAAVANAASTKLEIDKVEITSGSSTLKTGTTGNFKVNQGQELRIKVKLENLYSDSSDNDIEDVAVSARIRDIDDGDDLEESYDDTYMRADGYKTVTIELEIPEDADTDQSYDLEITAEGTDQNGTLQTDEAYFEIEVKESYDEEDEEQDAAEQRYLEEYYARIEQQRDSVERPVEQYANPNRDLRFLFAPEKQPVVLEIQQQLPMTQNHHTSTQKTSVLSIIALLLADMALIIFIALLINSYKSSN
jgi:hypothetical protein